MALRKSTRRLLLAFLLFSASSVAQSRPPQNRIGTDLSGHWQGLLISPDGEQRIVLTMKKDGKDYEGAFSFVDKPGLILYLHYLYLRGSKLRFDRSNEDHSYDGYEGLLSVDGKTIDGAWFHHTKPMPLVLHRVRDGEVEWQSTPPTPESLHRLLQAAWMKSALTRDGAKPFHLKAEVSVNGLRAVYDELWKDQLHWRFALDTHDEAFVQVSNGSNSYTFGKPPVIPVASSSTSKDDHSFALVLPRIQEALLSAVRPELRNSLRIKVSGGDVCDNNIIMDCTCINVEPQMKGIATAAQTEYCLSAYDGRIRKAMYPKSGNNSSYGDSEYPSDYTSFDGVLVPQKVEINTSAFTMNVQLHVLEITSAANFTILNQKPPKGIERMPPHSQEDLLASQLMLGQEIASPTVPWKFCVNSRGDAAKINVLLHIDTNGKVKSFDHINGPPECTDATHRAAVSEMMLQFQFRSSYRNGVAISVDRTVSIGHEPGEDD